MIGADAIDRFRELCDGARTVVLATHVNPDGDAVGSEVSLGSFLRERGCSVRVVNHDPTPELLRFVESADLPIEHYDPAVHDPVLRAADLVVLVDNSAPDRLGRMEPVLREVSDRTLCIDHHPMRDSPWAHNIVDVGSCATTAMIWRLARAYGWQPDAVAARALYVGLATDTGFFRFNSTTPEAHEIAAELLSLGVDTAAVYQAIYERNPVEYVRLLGHALTGLELAGAGAVAWVRIPRRLIDSLEAHEVDPTEILTAMLAIDGVRVAILFRELGDGRVKVSLRSKGALDVHRLATGFGGGGHRNASGIVMERSLDEAVRSVTDRALELLG